MKKIILSAAIAATMSVPAFADISIKGDAHFRYTARDTGTVQTNPTSQRVRLHVTGKSGDTTVKLGLRNDGGTRVSDGIRGAGGDSDDTADFPNGTGSPRGLRDGSSAGNSTSSNAIFAVDYLFLTTKIGGLNIKVGDWWATTGVGLVRKGVPITEGIVFGTKISGINASIKTVADSSENFFTFKGKLGGFKVALQTSDHDTDGYVDVMFKGKASGVGIAGEFWNGDVFDANVVHLWKTVNGITWHVARAEWDAQVAGGSNRFAANSKFSPLGVSILGSAPGVNGRTAIGNVNRGTRATDSDVFGVRADFKVAGMGVQVTAGNLDLGNPGTDDTFKDIIITRKLGKGSSIKVSYGDFLEASTIGAKVSVKF